MRILFSTQTYAPDANGQAVFSTRLAEGLVLAGHDVGVLWPADSFHSHLSAQNGVRLYRVGALSLKPWSPAIRLTLTPFRQITRIMDAFHPDIIHLQDHYPLSWAVSQVARRRRIPIIATNHFLPENLLRNMPVPQAAQKLLTRFLWQSCRLTYDRAALVTTPTVTAANILREQHFRPPIRPISCGIDLSDFRPRPQVARLIWRQKHGLACHKPLFVFVGRVDHEKCLDLFLRAAQQLPDHDFQAVIVGTGLDLKSLRQLAEHLALGDKVVFTGYVPAADLPYLLNSADVFVMPSEAELQSIATLEAMASGLPVLAADKLALPELVQSGRNGYLFPPGDATALAHEMAKMMDEQARWPGMGEASWQIASRHDVAETIQAYQAAYRQVLTATDMVGQPVKPGLSCDATPEP